MSTSLLSRSVSSLGTKFLKNLSYKDIDYRGFIDEYTDPTVEVGAVLINDLKLWLQSSKCDYYRRPSMGGFFDNIQKYTLNAYGADQLSSDLRSAIKANFTTVEIIDLQVVPDTDTRSWRMRMIVRDTLTGVTVPLTTDMVASFS